MKIGRVVHFTALVSVLCLAGCAARASVPAPAPVPRALPAPPRAVPDDDHDGLTVSGTLGRLDQADVDEQFRGSLSEINRCYTEALRRRWFLSGRMELRLRIARDGQVREAAVVQSSLGCYDLERCVLAVVEKLRFAPPQGGEAEVSYPVSFPQRAAVHDWPEDRVAPQMARWRAELSLCRARLRGEPPPALRVTMYIGPGGRVASAGLSADGPISAQLGACLAARALTWRFEDPLGQLVKASYALN